MKIKAKHLKYLGAAMMAALVLLFLMPDIAEARRGGRSFGGSRRSFSKKSTKPRTNKSRSKSTQARKAVPPTKKSSFGGNRMSSSKDYTSKYGAPRKAPKTVQGKNAAGQNVNYRMHGYGGYGSSLMAGYVMGSTSWMWMMPFHPAFYYSRPYYVNNPDGSIGVYPPTFSFSKLIFTLIILAIIAYIIVKLVRKKKSRNSRSYSQSSFG